MRKAFSVVLSSMMLATSLVGCSATGEGASVSPQPEKQENTATQETTNTTSQESAGATEKTELSGEITYLTATPVYAKSSKEISAEFNKLYPNVKVNIEHVSDNYESVLKTKMASGNAPDIFCWQGYFAMKDFVDGGKVADLSDYGFGEYILPNFMASGMSGDKLYGIPTVVQNVGLLYNKDVFAKAGITEVPRTVSQLSEAIEKIKAIGVQPFSAGLKEQWVAYDLFWFAQTPFVEDMLGWYDSMNAGTGTFKHDRMEEAFKTFDMIYANSGDKPLSDDFATLCHELAAGEVAMAIQGDWAYGETQKIDPNAALGMTGFPVDEVEGNAAILADNAEILYISEDSKNKEASVAFIQWMLSKEGAEYLGSLTNMPSTSSQNPNIELNVFAGHADQWIKDGNKTVPFAWNYWAPGIMDIVGKDMQEYFMGNMTLDQMMADLDSQWVK